MKIILHFSLVVSLSIPQNLVSSIQKRRFPPNAGNKTKTMRPVVPPRPTFNDSNRDAPINSESVWKMAKAKPPSDFTKTVTKQFDSKNNIGNPFGGIYSPSSKVARLSEDIHGTKTFKSPDPKVLNNAHVIPTSNMNSEPELRYEKSVPLGSKLSLNNIGDTAPPTKKEDEGSSINLNPQPSDELKKTENLLEALYKGGGIPFDAPDGLEPGLETLGPPIYPTGQKSLDAKPASTSSTKEKQSPI